MSEAIRTDQQLPTDPSAGVGDVVPEGLERHRVVPARTLEGVVRQLQAGERFAYSPELLELARRVIERERTDPIVDVEEWARRMARQAAELRD